MKYLLVIIPGPWWSPLTYSCTNLSGSAPLPGSRVLIPLGKAWRIGFFLRFVEPPSKKSPFTIREIGAFLEKTPPMGRDLWELGLWLSHRYLCPPGIAFRAFLPKELFTQEQVFEAVPRVLPKPGKASYSCFYSGDDEKRYKKYTAFLDSSSKGLFIFPEASQARRFWNILEKTGLETSGMLWDLKTRKKKELFRFWQKVRAGNFNFLVGTLGAIFAPLPEMDFIVVDQEESDAYVHRKSPFFHARSVLAKRGDFFSSRVFFAGRMPSSRIYDQLKPVCDEKPPSLFLFPYLAKASRVQLPGTETGIPLSKKLLEESLEILQKRETALWILDRGDENQELFCEDCGHVFLCSHCGGFLGSSGKKYFQCCQCGSRFPSVAICPECSGEMYTYRKAGLQSFHNAIQSLYGHHIRCYLYERSKKNGGLSLVNLKKQGGIVIGTRKILNLCDTIPVGIIAWLDADAEARKSQYNSQEKAFRMVWESAWRGRDGVNSRTIYLQSRASRKGWQNCLKRGWETFWKEELADRKSLSFPPYGSFIEIEASKNLLDVLEKELDEKKIAFSRLDLSLEEKNFQEKIWIKCLEPARVYDAVKDIFTIRNPYTKKEKSIAIHVWRD